MQNFSGGGFMGKGVRLVGGPVSFMGPARMGEVRMAGLSHAGPPAPPPPVLSALPALPALQVSRPLPRLSGSYEDLAQARRNLDQAQMAATRIQDTYDLLAELIGPDGAAQALNESTDWLERAHAALQVP